MSDDVIVEAKDGEAAAKPKGGKKKLMIIIGAAVLVLGGGGGGAAFFLMGSDKAAAKSAEGEQSEAEAEAESQRRRPRLKAARRRAARTARAAVYLDVPPLVVNLRSADGAARFLKVHISCWCRARRSTVEKLQGKLPLADRRLSAIPARAAPRRSERVRRSLSRQGRAAGPRDPDAGAGSRSRTS
jgi:flagellar basal body-associated protein FliL